MKEILLVFIGGAIGFLSAIGMKLIMDHNERR